MEALVDLRTGPHTGAVHAALAPEAGAVHRSRVALEPASGRLRLRITADDLPALRATLNSFLGWADCALEVAETHDARTS